MTSKDDIQQRFERTLAAVSKKFAPFMLKIVMEERGDDDLQLHMSMRALAAMCFKYGEATREMLIHLSPESDKEKVREMLVQDEIEVKKDSKEATDNASEAMAEFFKDEVKAPDKKTENTTRVIEKAGTTHNVRSGKDALEKTVKSLVKDGRFTGHKGHEPHK